MEKWFVGYSYDADGCVFVEQTMEDAEKRVIDYVLKMIIEDDLAYDLGQDDVDAMSKIIDGDLSGVFDLLSGWCDVEIMEVSRETVNDDVLLKNAKKILKAYHENKEEDD